MPPVEIVPGANGRPALSACPECRAGLAVLKVIPGRIGRGSGCEYWTMRCIGCGSIHLDIVEPAGGQIA